jgi:WD40 repeat protein
VATTKGVDFFLGTDQVASLGGLAYQPTAVALAPGEDEVAVGGDDSKTHIYSLADIGSIAEVTAVETRSAVSALAYSPGGDLLAIGDAGRQVEVYDRGSWQARVKGKWVFHTSRVTCLAWSPGGAYLASGSLDENIILWSLERPSAKLQLPFAHMAGVSGIAFLSEERLVSAGNDHSVVTWKLPAESAW